MGAAASSKNRKISGSDYSQCPILIGNRREMEVRRRWIKGTERIGESCPFIPMKFMNVFHRSDEENNSTYRHILCAVS
jgi:hypothetical protein